MAADHTALTEIQHGSGARIAGGRPPVVAALLLVSLLAADALAQRASPPARIVSLVPAVTEMLYALGAGDAVAAVSSFDRFPPDVRSKPRVGALLDPDFERILALRPDLVVVYASQTEFIARLERSGLSLFRYEHAGLADITATIRALGDRLDRRARAEDLARSIERDLDAIRARVAGRPRPRTAIVVSRELGALRGIWASGGFGFLHDMLGVAGGEDVFADVRRQNLQVTAELLLARAPEVVIEIHADDGWTPERIARERAVWGGLPGLPAVRNGRVHVVADVRLAIPGPRAAEAVTVLADLLHGAGR